MTEAIGFRDFNKTLGCMAGLAPGKPDEDGGFYPTEFTDHVFRAVPIALVHHGRKELRDFARAAAGLDGEDAAAAMATAYMVSELLEDTAIHEIGPKRDRWLRGIEGFSGSEEFMKKVRQADSLTRLPPSVAYEAIGNDGAGDAFARAFYSCMRNGLGHERSVNEAGGLGSVSGRIAGALCGSFNGIEGMPYSWMTDCDGTAFAFGAAQKLYLKSNELRSGQGEPEMHIDFPLMESHVGLARFILERNSIFRKMDKNLGKYSAGAYRGSDHMIDIYEGKGFRMDIGSYVKTDHGGPIAIGYVMKRLAGELPRDAGI